MAALMIQGCGSDVGKSILTAGLCRAFTNRGLKVRPFKPQNMSNNAAVTPDGGEIGRAQALQALACRTPLSVHMNPVLLKPDSDVDAQVVVLGCVWDRCSASDYQRRKAELLPIVLDSFAALSRDCDLVIVEGAGSPAEINLRSGDIANMGFARPTGTPVILVGDIDRGHVIAALVGAHSVLDPLDRDMVRGFIINKFRGDATLFDSGRREIVARTGWRDIGLVPWLRSATRLPSEDTLVRSGERGSAEVRVAIPQLARIANFDEFDALRAEPNVDLRFIPPGTALPGDSHLVILPGTKATIADLAFFREQGWDIDLLGHIRRGGYVLGVCGGYQMLGRRISDPQGMEGAPNDVEGLGLLDIETVLTGDKILKPATGVLTESGVGFEGYEMHVGRTTGAACARPLLRFASGIPDGAVSTDRHVAGAYVHGLFNLPAPRAVLLAPFGIVTSGVDHNTAIDDALEELARELERALAIDELSDIAGVGTA